MARIGMGLLVFVLLLTAYNAEAQDWWPMFHHDTCHTGYSTSTAPDTNQVLWSYINVGVYESSPAVVDGKVYIGSDGPNVYCLDALTGDFIWSYTTGSLVCSSPAVADGKVFVGSTDDNVYCLDAETGDFIWSFTTGDHVYSSPAVVDGKVYVGSFDFKVYCLDVLTGDFIWSYTTGHYVYSSPAVADGKVYVGSYDYNIYCLNATTGDSIWSYTTGNIVKSSPAVADGKVYVGSHDYNVYCLDASTGDSIWSYNTGDGGIVSSSPAVADGKVYVGSWDVYCLNATTGDSIWSYITGGGVVCSPAVADGKVYVGDCSYADFYCLDASTGDFIWSYEAGHWNGDGVYSSPAVVDGKVYVTAMSGAIGNLYCFGPYEGTCCDDETGDCWDDYLQEECDPSYRWTRSTLCADLDPPCGGCPEDIITIYIFTDSYPDETSWDLKDHETRVVIASGTPDAPNAPYTWAFCMGYVDCYDFTIYDSYGDGICCDYGDGLYEVYFNGGLVGSGGVFDFSETVALIGNGCIFPTGACCVALDCVETNYEAECDALGGTWYAGEDCATFTCPDPTVVPTLSEWGMIILALLLLAVGTVAVMRRKVALSKMKV